MMSSFVECDELITSYLESRDWGSFLYKKREFSIQDFSELCAGFYKST